MENIWKCQVQGNSFIEINLSGLKFKNKLQKFNAAHSSLGLEIVMKYRMHPQTHMLYLHTVSQWHNNFNKVKKNSHRTQNMKVSNKHCTVGSKQSIVFNQKLYMFVTLHSLEIKYWLTMRQNKT